MLTDDKERRTAGMVEWDARYAGDAYFYGETPNHFLESLRDRFQPGMRAILPADGEGRNGVWLAGLGLHVESIEGSPVAVRKSLALAASRGVTIHAEAGDLADWAPAAGEYDLAVSIFVHLPPSLRQHVHAAMVRALKPGGLLVLESFRPEQLAYHSGGPKDASMLYTREILTEDFREMEIELLEEQIVFLDESDKHRGEAAVIRCIARR